jgi:hypothetical protein
MTTKIALQSPFNVDFDDSDDEYLYVDIPSRLATVVIKIEDDGVIAEIWPLNCVHEPAATAHALTTNLRDHASTDPPAHT